jgi:putative oxidoreductase
MANSLETRVGHLTPTVIGICRIVIGFLWALHGTAKLFGWPASSSGRVPFGTWPYWWAGVIELAVGVLLMLGLFTLPAALLGSGTMAFAYFTEHQPDGLLPIQNKGELSVVYCFAFLLLAFVGPGAFALSRRRD